MITDFKLFESNTEPLYIFTVLDLEEVIWKNKHQSPHQIGVPKTIDVLQSLIGSFIKMPSYVDKFYLCSVRLKNRDEYQSSTGRYILSFIEDQGGYPNSLVNWEHGHNSAESACPDMDYNEIIEVYQSTEDSTPNLIPTYRKILEVTTKKIKQRRTEKRFDL